jgi:homogentisate 1,2-dioxygenase
MPYYRSQGSIPSKHFTVLRRPGGEQYYEELLSSSGFNGPAALLYRLRNSTRVASVEPFANTMLESWNDGTTRNHRLDVELVKGHGAEFEARTSLFFNDDLVYSISKPTEGGERFYRNGYHDELLLIAKGSGTFESMFGEIAYRPLDFVYVPRGTTWRLRPNSEDHTIVVMETRTPVRPPERYRNAAGQFLARSLYSERDIRGPALPDPKDELGDFEIVVRTDDQLSLYTMDAHPFDVVGWDGALYPYALNMLDLEPVSGRVNLMPDMHQVFESEGTAICAIVPGRLPDHPNAYPSIIDHNADCDEIFYRIESAGRAIPGVGTVTLHTRAAQHGPKPGAPLAKPGLTSELIGLIIDVTRPMHLNISAMDSDEEGYVRAWM